MRGRRLLVSPGRGAMSRPAVAAVLAAVKQPDPRGKLVELGFQPSRSSPQRPIGNEGRRLARLQRKNIIGEFDEARRLGERS